VAFVKPLRERPPVLQIRLAKDRLPEMEKEGACLVAWRGKRWYNFHKIYRGFEYNEFTPKRHGRRRKLEGSCDCAAEKPVMGDHVLFVLRDML